MAKIGLVTVLFNSDTVLDGFFKSLSIQTYRDFHLYLIDNTVNSVTDELIDQLTAKYAITAYTHIKNDGNFGVAKGNNQGIELSLASGTSHTLLLNNDIEFEQPGLLADMIGYAEENDEQIIIPKIYFFDSRKVWMAGGRFLLGRGSTQHVGEGDDDKGQYDEEAVFKYAPTCFMLLNNEVFDAIGLMDEKYFVYYDDTDFMYRAYKAGYTIKLLPNLHVLHKVSSLTGGDESLFSIYYGNRNRLYFIRKNFKGLQLAGAIGFTLGTRILKYLTYDKNQRVKLMAAIADGLKM